LSYAKRLRKLLAAEGLFDAARKRRPPFLPRCIGLVTGRGSAAEHDVVTNAQARWPAVRFRIENTAVQGALMQVGLLRCLAIGGITRYGLNTCWRPSWPAEVP
jgi:exodeoxyribonuclease VII large subunit